MPQPATMTIDERRKYLALMQPRYRQANRSERSHLLDEMATVTLLQRKSLLRLLPLADLERRPRQRQRGRTYDHTVDDALRIIAETLDNKLVVT